MKRTALSQVSPIHLERLVFSLESGRESLPMIPEMATSFVPMSLAIEATEEINAFGSVAEFAGYVRGRMEELRAWQVRQDREMDRQRATRRWWWFFLSKLVDLERSRR